MMNVITKHLIIHGLVQGVGYRSWMVQQANGLGLTGWVRNRLDGTVEAVIVGKREAVLSFIASAEKGPTLARVARVVASDWIGTAPTSFKQLPTA